MPIHNISFSDDNLKTGSIMRQNMLSQPFLWYERGYWKKIGYCPHIGSLLSASTGLAIFNSM
jgi:hypothetical protein